MKALKIIILVLCPAFLAAYSNEFNPPHWPAEGYNSNYFILGIPESKLQISTKFRAIAEGGLFVAYTQQMYWELWKDSHPMYDVNYNPDMFFRVVVDGLRSAWLDIGLLDHESNGLQGENSRSWNKVYLRYTDGIFVGEQNELHWTIKAWYPYAPDPTSPDLQRYRGTFELQLTVNNLAKGLFDRNDLTIRVYPGGPSSVDLLKGGQEITLRGNLFFMDKILPVMVLQFFHGYGERLFDYKTERTVFRAGVGF